MFKRNDAVKFIGVAFAVVLSGVAASTPQDNGAFGALDSGDQTIDLPGGASVTLHRIEQQIVMSGGTGVKTVTLTGAARASLLAMPDGSVWIEGVQTPDGAPSGGQVIDVKSGLLSPAASGLPSLPGGHYIVLPDDRVLAVPSDGSSATIWNPTTGIAFTQLGISSSRIQGLTALRDGSVLIDDGQPTSPATQVYDPATGALRTLSAAEVADFETAVPTWTAAAPIVEASAASPAQPIVVSLSKSIDASSVTPSSVVLLGPGGPVSSRLALVDDGRLLVVTPDRDLFTGSRYTVFLKGLRAVTGIEMPFGSYGFSTATLGANSTGSTTTSSSQADASQKKTGSTGEAQGAGAATTATPALHLTTGPQITGVAKVNEDCVPGARTVVLCRTHSQIRDGAFYPGRDATLNTYGGHWRTYLKHVEALGRPLKLMRSHVRPNLAAASSTGSGPASITGRILTIEGRAVAGVTVSSGKASAQTGFDGVFSLKGLALGQQTLFVDGASASHGDVSYGSFEVGATVPDIGVLKLAYNMYLPRVLPRDKISITSPTTQDLAISHPDVPGLEIDIPAGTVIHDRNGKVVTELAIVPTPVDRAPFPTNNNYPVYFSIIPGGAVIQNLSGQANQGIRIKYPNYSHAKAGTIAKFWNYDTKTGWQVYGKGRVSADGTQFVPDDGVALTTTIHGSFTLQPDQGGLTGNPDCGCNGAGDPVDLATGALVHTWRDLGITDIVPLSLERTYRSGDTAPRAFGVGMSSSFDWYLYDEKDDFSQPKLVLPNLASLPFNPILGDPADSGNDVLAEWKYAGMQGAFVGSTLQHVAYVHNQFEEHWIIQMRNGTQYWFQNEQTNRLNQIVDRFGNVTSFDLSSGLLDSVTSPSGRTISFSYDEDNRISSAVDSAGRTVGYVYDEAGYLSEVDYPDATKEKYTYDTAGELLTITDRRGNISLTNQWNSGRVSQQTFADATTIKLAYVMGSDGYSTKTTVTEPNGASDVSEFDPLTHYPLTETAAAGTASAQTTIYTRDSLGYVTSRIDSLGRKTTMSYDTLGNLTSLTALAGTAKAATVAFTYTPDFNLVSSITDPLGHVTQFGYTNGCMTSMTNPLKKVAHATCNAAGQTLTATDPLGHGVTYTYSGLDPRTRADSLGRTTTYTTDDLGRAIATQDAAGNTSLVSYDVDDRVLQATDARGQVTQYAYDPNGNLLSVTAPGNKVVSFAYDSSNRVTQRKDGLGQIVYFTYDTLGNVATAKDRKGQTTTLQYDLLGRRTLTTFADGSTIGRAYDEANRLTGLTDSINGSISRGYDDFDRLASESGPQGTVTYQYDAASRRTQAVVGAQAAITYGYDDANRMTDLTQGADHVVLGYDDANRRSALTLPNGVKGVYSYDASNALLGIAYSAPSAGDLGSVDYTYDAAGNLASRTGTLAGTVASPASTATYDADNRATTFNGARLTYDADGNLTSDATHTYVWNARNQLTAIQQGDTVQASFTYDALGRRTAKTLGGVATQYLYDGLNAAQETQDGVVNPILNGLGIDERYARNDVTGRTYFLTDALGSTVALTDTTGALVQQYQYDSYGNVTTTGSAANPYQYTGRENDGNGLYYYRARYYSPGMGRFISEDPIGFSGGLNFYAYVGNDPLTSVDPLGLATAIIVGDASGWNFAGHVAIAFTGQGVYSYGTGTPFGSSTTAYMASQAAYRSSTVYVLDTTPDQEAAMIAYLNRNYSPQSGQHYSIFNHSCATAVNGALGTQGIGEDALMGVAQAGGILLPQLPDTAGFIGGTYPGASVISVPKGAAIPGSFSSFNPTGH